MDCLHFNMKVESLSCTIFSHIGIPIGFLQASQAALPSSGGGAAVQAGGSGMGAVRGRRAPASPTPPGGERPGPQAFRRLVLRVGADDGEQPRLGSPRFCCRLIF